MLIIYNMSLDNYATITCECASAICACQIVSIEKQDVTVKAYACETVNIIISGTIFTINRQQVIDNSILICNALNENPSEENIQLPTIAENGWTKEFGYFHSGKFQKSTKTRLSNGLT